MPERMNRLARTYGPMFETFFRKDGTELYRDLVPLLAEGRPVSAERLAAERGRSPGQVAEAMRRLPGIEYDDAGRVIGAGLTLEPTRHRFGLGGRTLYTWCAWDTLVYPPILDRAAEVQSTCPATGETVHLRVTPRGVADVEPLGAVMSFPDPDLDRVGHDVRAAFCERSNFFRSEEAARERLEGRDDVDILTPEEGFELGRRLPLERPAKQEGGDGRDGRSRGGSSETITCDTSALDEAERERHEEVSRTLLTSVADVRETPNGYALVLPPDDGTVREAGAFISRERRCCPFLEFTLEVGTDENPVLLTLSGGDGVKPYLERTPVAALAGRSASSAAVDAPAVPGPEGS